MDKIRFNIICGTFFLMATVTFDSYGEKEMWTLFSGHPFNYLKDSCYTKHKSIGLC